MYWFLYGTGALSIFLIAYFTLNVNILSSSHKKELLEIKYLGDSQNLHLRLGNKRLLLYKYYFNKFKSVKSHQEKIKELIELNHYSINASEYVTYKLLVFIAISIFTLVLLIFKYNESVLTTIYLNSNILILYILTCFAFLKLDSFLLKQQYEIKKKYVKEELQFFSTLFQMSVESGDNLVSALRSATVESTGLLKNEMEMALDEYDSGVHLSVALANLENRLKVDEMSYFISFLKRASQATYDDFTSFVEAQRVTMQIFEVNQAKEYEKTIPNKLTAINMLSFVAEMLVGFAPIIYLLFEGLNF